jgi:phenylacetate-coenzyme A ligase PaaK-like adenylate-forming protein
MTPELTMSPTSLFDQEAYVVELLKQPIYGLAKAQKRDFFLSNLKRLSIWHYEHCLSYRRILASEGVGCAESLLQVSAVEQAPYLSIQLFKSFVLSSITEDRIFKVLRSSGTTSQVKSQVVLDRETAALQTRILIKIMQEFIGKQRLPMLVVDMPLAVGNKSSDGYSARGAGVQGLSFLGRDHTYLLDENLELDIEQLKAFAAKYINTPILIFGFTYIVWQSLIMKLKEAGVQFAFSEAVLLHSGGWKKMQSQSVSNQVFKQSVDEVLGISRVHDFYGMAEQVGSVFVECEQGFLHVPSLAEIVVRDAHTLQPVPHGQTGVIQVLSLLPLSYPGHSLLTEDLGEVKGEDNCRCGRMGKYFVVYGRVPKTENRGCSDTVN